MNYVMYHHPLLQEGNLFNSTPPDNVFQLICILNLRSVEWNDISQRAVN